MPNDYKDVTDQYKDRVQRPSPLVVCELKQVFAGTFCFPFGQGFGCGAALEVEQGREYSLEAKLGAEGKGLTGEITYGTKYTFSIKWSYTSGKCEYCRPEICFPNSNLQIFECERFLAFWSWTDIKKIFTPGPQGEISANCTQNDPKCGCKDEKTSALPTGGRLSFDDRAASSCVMTPTRFARRLDPDEPSDAKKTADAALAVLENSLPRSLGSEGALQTLGVSTPDGIHWIYPRRADRPGRVSLLSTDCRDTSRGRGPRRLSGRFLPVLAVTGCAPEATAEVSLALTTPDGKERRLAEDVEVRTGICTVLWSEFDLGPKALEPGTTARLHIRLDKPDGCRLGELVETFRVPLQPAG